MNPAPGFFRWGLVADLAGWHRMHLVPRNRLVNLYLHRYAPGFTDDRKYGLHDHPWWFLSVRLRGTIYETYHPSLTPPAPGCRLWRRSRIVPRICVRSARWAHALMVSASGPAMTLNVTGPVIRRWGFWTEDGWRSAASISAGEME